MIRLEYNPKGGWRLIGLAEDVQQNQATALMQDLANLTGTPCRVSRQRASAPPEVIAYCEPARQAAS